MSLTECSCRDLLQKYVLKSSASGALIESAADMSLNCPIEPPGAWARITQLHKSKVMVLLKSRVPDRRGFPTGYTALHLAVKVGKESDSTVNVLLPGVPRLSRV